MAGRRVLVGGLVVAALAVGTAVALYRPAARHGPPPLRLAKVGSFDQPVYVTAPPGDRRRLFVVERSGRIRVIRDGRRLARPFLDLSRVVKYGGPENGFLSMVFAPDYARTGRFYVDYTGKDNDVRVLEYRRATSDVADPRTRRLVVLLRKPRKRNPRKQRKKETDTHNGGLLLFGPDRLLYIGIGDGGGSYDRHDNGQRLGTLLGKILRIDPRRVGNRAYRVPGDNPFVHRPGARAEIYAYGLRNPWRFAFDPSTHAMIITDVGQDSEEEINFAARGQAAGRNYGWRVFEGFERTKYAPPYEKVKGAVPPVYSYHEPPHSCTAIVGGVVVRDPTLRGYVGRYLYGDYCNGRIHSIVLGPGSARSNALAVQRALPTLTSFGEDAAGHIYVCTLAGAVYRLLPPAPKRRASG